MFRTTISSTPFTSDIANDFFHNIRGESFQSDVSFLATLRALLAPRINDHDSISLRFTSSNYSKDAVRDSSKKAVVGAITSNMPLDCNGMFIIHNFRSDEASNLANIKVVEDAFTEEYGGYFRLDKVTTFFEKSFSVLCFVNPEKKNVILFSENLDIKRIHYLQMAILPTLPWYFKPEDGVSEVEMALIESLKERTSEKYKEHLKNIATNYDFKSAKIRKLLNGFEYRHEQVECEKFHDKIQQIDRIINELNVDIGERLKNRDEYCTRLLGLKIKITQNDGDSEIMEYFLCNNRLYLEEVVNTTIQFCVADYLTYFDKEMAERMLDNKRSYVYVKDDGNMFTAIEPTRMEKLLRAIFIDESIRIKFCAAYSLTMNGGISALSRHAFPAECGNYMPNPHIDRFECLGNYSTTINKLLHDSNHIGAIEQCVASCKSLNLGDLTVMRCFIENMYASEKKCIELPDGNVVDSHQAIEWLENQKADIRETEELEETTNE